MSSDRDPVQKVGDYMGKGSWNGRAPSALELSRFNQQEEERQLRQRRLNSLHSMGYETAEVDGEWYYRDKNQSDDWTPMDNPDSYYNKYLK